MSITRGSRGPHPHHRVCKYRIRGGPIRAKIPQTPLALKRLVLYNIFWWPNSEGECKILSREGGVTPYLAELVGKRGKTTKKWGGIKGRRTLESRQGIRYGRGRSGGQKVRASVSLLFQNQYMDTLGLLMALLSCRFYHFFRYFVDWTLWHVVI